MLRLAPDKLKDAPPAPPVPEPEIPQEDVAAPHEESLGDYPSKLIPQPIVVYMTSDMGPFECQNCLNFEEDGSCAVVAGPIDPKGVCHVFEPKSADMGDNEAPPDAGAAPPEMPPPPQ